MSRHPKRNQLTLDLTASQTQSKRSRVNNEILTSPDVQMLKLSSPQLEAFLSRGPLGATPTPGSGYTFPTTITAEQELYVKEFDEALRKKHAEAAAAASAAAAAAAAAASSGNPSIIAIEKATSAFKQHQQLVYGGGGVISEPLTVVGASSLPSTVSDISEPPPEIKQEPEEAPPPPPPLPPLLLHAKRGRGGRGRRSTSSTSSSASQDSSKISPIDMDAQERIKLERKRLRNRLAAHKCRKRKLEKISNLDDKVKDLKDQNSELTAVLKKLKDSVCNLKQEVMEHMNSGCQINMMAVMGDDHS